MAAGNVILLDAARKALRTGEDVRPDRLVDDVVLPESYPVYRPRDVLPHPKKLDGLVAWDTETSALYCDDGGRVAVVSVAYRTVDDPDTIQAYAFPFDQGRADDKGFEPIRDKFGALKVDVQLASTKRKTDLVTWDGVHVPRGFRVVENKGRRFLQVDLESWEREVNLSEQDWKDMCRWLGLAGEHVGLCGHNDKFDIEMTETGTRHWEGIDLDPYITWDTMLAAKQLWPLQPMALKPTGARLWGRDVADEAREVKEGLAVLKMLYGLVSDDGPRYDLLPWDINGPYATQDAWLTKKLADYQIELFDGGEAEYSEYWPQHDLMRTLCRIERRGFGPLDRETTERVAVAIESRIHQLEGSLPFNPPTAYKAKEYFFDDLGLRPWRGAEESRLVEEYTNKKGGISKRVIKQGSLSVDVCNRMAQQGVTFAAEVGELLRLRTANTMHYRGYLNLAGPDGRVRTNFRQATVRSGRMSVERFQAQAIPRRDSVKIKALPGYDGPIPHPRDLFLTPPGRQRVTMDLSQAELRVAAKFSGCKRMLEQIYDGRDIHGEMATQIFGVEKGDPEFTHYRYISKRGVFGGIFMVGPRTFRETIWKLAQLWLPWDECKKTIDGFRSLYPEIEEAYVWSQDFVRQHGYVELIDGSKSWYGHNDYDNTAWNRRVQGSLALFNAHWLVECEYRTSQWDALVLSVHDSVTLDLPDEHAERVPQEIAAWTAEEFERWFEVPGKTDIEYGY